MLPSIQSGPAVALLFAVPGYAPEEFAGGATLFHEHLSLGPDFGERFRAASQAVLTARGAPPRGAPPLRLHPRPTIRCVMSSS
jgi:hypothetical protein